MNEQLIKEEIKKQFRKLFKDGVSPLDAAFQTKDKIYNIMIIAAKEIKDEEHGK